MIRAFLIGTLLTFLGVGILTFLYNGDINRAIEDWRTFAAVMLVAGSVCVLIVMVMTRRR